MPSYKVIPMVILALVTSSAMASAPNMSWIQESNDRARQVEEQLKEEGILERFLPEQVEQQIQPYMDEAQSLSDQSASHTRQVFAQYDGLDVDVDLSNIDINTTASHQKGDTHQVSSLSAIFVSFSMTGHELQESFFEAEAEGAEIYFIGLHPDDKGIPDTMIRLREIINNNNLTVTARFNPAAFDEFNIQAVPTLLHAKQGSIGLVSGVMSFQFLKERMEDKKGLNHLGSFGPTKQIIETNILEEIQARLNKVDFEQKKKAAVDNFWSNRAFVDVPDADEDAEFYMDPTVRVTADIVTPNGDVLARAGDVINPIRANPTPNTYLLINAMNRDHLRWAAMELSKIDDKSIVMLMTSRLDTDNGWDHLGSLRSHFHREIYLIPKELVERFSITGLPAIVKTDTQKHLMHIKQVNLKFGGNR